MSETRGKFAKDRYDAVVVGSGPNGMAAALVMLQHGLRTVVVEQQSTIGGGCRSKELTLPGFVHDVCSSIHPLGIGSPYLRTLPLNKFGLKWIHPDALFAHPLDGGRCVTAERSIEETADQLGADGGRYKRLMQPIVPTDWDAVCEVLRQPYKMIRHPLKMADFGLKALQSAEMIARSYFETEAARGMFAGVAAHSSLPLTAPASASFGLVLALAGHAVGWPLPKGGAQKLTDAMVAYLVSLGGELVISAPITSPSDLPEAKYLLLDITPQQVLSVFGDKLPSAYRKRLEGYKYGPGVFKIDWALDGPIPWAAPACSRSATVHIGPTLEEMIDSESGNWSGRTAHHPYVLLAQTSLFDPSRAPEGKHTGWAYCHVPNACKEDMTDRIESQIERFAPGFRQRILARFVSSPRELQLYNANYIGGDINGGALTLGQLFTRPLVQRVPWSLPMDGTYMCSSSTPPGGGVHGMSGYYAAQCALRGWR